MKRTEISELLKGELLEKSILVKGWVRAFRNSMFISLNDGSCITNLQCVIEDGKFSNDIIKKISNGSAVSINGILKKSSGKGQDYEVLVSEIDILGECPGEEYPLQPKAHSLEFLREIAHLRPRTQIFSSVMRIRSRAAFAVHKYFTEKGFFYFNAPIITGSDCEGAGEMFCVTNISHKNPPKNQNGDIDFSKDFFGKQTNLTVSGQLEAETYAMALGKVYTFGPTFRAENSNTSRHLAEFWMIEPEVAFADLEEDMDLAEDFIKYVIKYVLENSKSDLEFLNARFEKEQSQKPTTERESMGLVEKLMFILNNDFQRVSYTEAIDILQKSKENQKGKFKYPIDKWGIDLQSEHERFLVEKHFKKPVILFDYPADIKAFYMRLSDDKKTVRAMDVLFPGIGEIVGGSQREERLDVLKERIKQMGIDEKELWWYLDTRKFGTAVHSGFGLGFERLVLFLTGMSNIRDVIPFPRYPESADF